MTAAKEPPIDYRRVPKLPCAWCNVNLRLSEPHKEWCAVIVGQRKGKE